MATLPEIYSEALGMPASLAARLEHYADGLKAHAPELAAGYGALVERLRTAAAGAGVPDIGDGFPDFVLPDEAGALVASNRLLGRGSLVVSFNRGHWCSFCKLELATLSRIVTEIAALGASIVSITPERNAYCRRFKADAGFAGPVLSDVDLATALSLGLAIPVGEPLEKLLSAIDVPLPVFHGTSSWLLPIPATFVIAADGVIAARFVDADFRHRMEPEAILDALRRLKSVQPNAAPEAPAAHRPD